MATTTLEFDQEGAVRALEEKGIASVEAAAIVDMVARFFAAPLAERSATKRGEASARGWLRRRLDEAVASIIAIRADLEPMRVDLATIRTDLAEGRPWRADLAQLKFDLILIIGAMLGGAVAILGGLIATFAFLKG